MPRRKYSEEYKQEAVALTQLPGATIRGVARDLGINPNMLGKWRRHIRGHGQKAFPGQGHARDEEVMQLKRELARVKKERDFFKRSGSVLRQRTEVKYRMIERCRDAFPIRMMCRHLGVSPSGYYEWLERPKSARAKENEALSMRTPVLHAASDGVLGRRPPRRKNSR